MKLRAMNDIVIAEEDKAEVEIDARSGLTKDVVSALKSGKLIAPETAKDYVEKFPCTGKVIATGPKCSNCIKVGDKIKWNRFGYERIKINGKDHVFVKEGDILAVFC